MSRETKIIQISEEIKCLQSELLRIQHHDLRSNEQKVSDNSATASGKTITMINMWNKFYYRGDSVPLRSPLQFLLESTGKFTISVKNAYLGSGFLNEYTDGYGDNKDTNQQSIAARLIRSCFRVYHIQILLSSNTVLISGRNSDNYSDIENWIGSLADSGEMRD